MNFLASATQQGFPQWCSGAFLNIYFGTWVTAAVLGFFINRKISIMRDQGVEGLPDTRCLHQSFASGWEQITYLFRGRFKDSGDSGFIVLCQIQRILVVLILLMLLAVLSNIFLILSVRRPSLMMESFLASAVVTLKTSRR